MVEDRNQSATFGFFARDLIGNGTSFRFCARGKSMWPTIRDGDTLHVEPIKKAPRIGDIVLFFGKGHFKAHRIVGRSGSHYVTRGDASMETDGVVRGEEILGRVVAKACPGNGDTVRLNCAREKFRFMARKLRACVSRLLRSSVAGSYAAAILVMIVPLSLGARAAWRLTALRRSEPTP